MVIAVIGPSETDARWPGLRGGALRYAAQLPVLRVHCHAPVDATAEALAATVDETLRLRPGVVCLHVDQPEVARAAALRIVADRVLLVTVGQVVEEVTAVAHVGIDLPAAAELLGENLERVAAGRQSYLLVHEAGRGTVPTHCYQRFMAKARRQFDVRLLAEGHVTATDGRGERVLEDLLSRYPRAGLVVTLNAELWLRPLPGWEQDLRSLNPEFRFATLAAPPTFWARLGRPGDEGPVAALVGPLDGDLGYAAVEAATDALLHHRQTAPRIIPCEVVTPETLADFARRYSAAAGGLDVTAYLPIEAEVPSGG